MERPWINDSTIGDLIRILGSLATGTTYYWRVNARNPSGTSAWSTIRMFTTMPIPTLLSPAQDSTGLAVNLNLTWASMAGVAATYRVQLSTDSSFTALVVNDSTPANPSRAVGPLANNTKYYWRVNAKNNKGTSPYSTVRRFTTVSGTGVLADGLSGGFGLRRGTLFYTLPASSSVQIRLLDLKGTQIWAFRTRQEAGPQGVDLPRSGGNRSLYLLEFRAGAERKLLKVLLE
jgi:hypothetical protein